MLRRIPGGLLALLAYVAVLAAGLFLVGFHGFQGPQPRSTVLGTTAASTSTSVSKSSGTLRVLVIRPYWDQPDITVTTSVLRRLAVTGLDAWYRQASYGALGITGDVVPMWLPIQGPTDENTCWSDKGNERRITSQAKAAARSAGFDSTHYDRTIVFFPRNNCSPDTPGGWADQPGSDITIAGIAHQETFVHELGHTLGLSHAVHALCMNAAGKPAVLAAPDRCGGFPEESLSTMGDAPGFSFDAAEKHQLGWMGGHEVRLRPGHSVTIAPLENPARVDAAYVVAPGRRTYWLELRRRIGIDRAFPAQATRGVLVHLTDPTYNPGSVLLDLHPGTLPDDPYDPDELVDAALGPGESWRSPDGFTFRVTRVRPGGVTVSLTR